MSVAFSSAAFHPRQPPRAAPQKKAGPVSSNSGGQEKGRRQPEAALTVGQPLPMFGTCHHYGHSHRYLSALTVYGKGWFVSDTFKESMLGETSYAGLVTDAVGKIEWWIELLVAVQMRDKLGIPIS